MKTETLVEVVRGMASGKINPGIVVVLCDAHPDPAGGVRIKAEIRAGELAPVPMVFDVASAVYEHFGEGARDLAKVVVAHVVGEAVCTSLLGLAGAKAAANDGV